MTGDKDFDELIARCVEIMKTKSNDYAEEGDRLAEIRKTAQDMGLTMRQVLGVYMSKHWRSVQKWVRGEELLGEGIKEKLADIATYAMICNKLVNEESGKHELDEPRPLCKHMQAFCAECDAVEQIAQREEFEEMSRAPGTCRFHHDGCPPELEKWRASCNHECAHGIAYNQCMTCGVP